MSTADGEVLYFTAQGEGAPVVLVHGLGSSLHEWDPVIPALVEAGYRAYACDLPGHGESPKPGDPGQYQIQAVVDRLVSWIDGLSLEEPFILAGHSLGGYLSLKFALQVPSRLRGLLLIDPLYSPEQIPGLVRLLPRLLEAGEKVIQTVPDDLLLALMKLHITPSSRLPVTVREQEAADIKRASPWIMRMLESVYTLQPELEQVELPVLVIWGDQDRSLSPKSFPPLIAGLPKAQGRRMAGCGHHPHLERPEEVNAAIKTFLAELFKNERQNSSFLGGGKADL